MCLLLRLLLLLLWLLWLLWLLLLLFVAVCVVVVDVVVVVSACCLLSVAWCCGDLGQLLFFVSCVIHHSVCVLRIFVAGRGGLVFCGSLACRTLKSLIFVVPCHFISILGGSTQWVVPITRRSLVGLLVNRGGPWVSGRHIRLPAGQPRSFLGRCS